MKSKSIPVFLLFVPMSAALLAQVVPGSLDVRWDPGAADCGTSHQQAIQVQAYEPATYILRQNLCVSAEGNFLYLLLGSKRALLIDDGAVADPAKMPVAKTVLGLLPVQNGVRLPLLVAHTHRHLDHRAGDAQFEKTAGVDVVPYDLEGVKRFYGFLHWPDGQAEIDLGDRTVDVIPSPGHEATHVVFYDRRTALLFTGDFLLNARLLIDDTAAERASAARVVGFAQRHSIAWVLGAHIEKNVHNELYSWGTHYHPDEHRLELTKDDLLQFPGALAQFNGLYTERGEFIMMNSIRVLMLQASAVLLVLIALIWMTVRIVRKRRALV